MWEYTLKQFFLLDFTNFTEEIMAICLKHLPLEFKTSKEL